MSWSAPVQQSNQAESQAQTGLLDDVCIWKTDVGRLTDDGFPSVRQPCKLYGCTVVRYEKNESTQDLGAVGAAGSSRTSKQYGYTVLAS